MSGDLSQFFMNHLVNGAATIVMPLMLLTFVGGIGLRVLMYYVARVESRFSREFEKRVIAFFGAQDAPKVASFYRLSRILFEKTYMECFDNSERPSLADRLFLIKIGVRRLIDDNLRQARYLKRNGVPPKMIELVKGSFEANPYFNRLLGILPIATLHELLNILPGLFLIGGILGTFLGISQGLPELGGMDVANVQETKRIMDLFLATIAHAMIKSIVGIVLSASMTVVNTLLSVEGLYYGAVNRTASALDHLWNETTTNEAEAVVPAAPSQAA